MSQVVHYCHVLLYGHSSHEQSNDFTRVLYQSRVIVRRESGTAARRIHYLHFRSINGIVQKNALYLLVQLLDQHMLYP
jgi:hypothetical protein